jgi:hypothetical protein
MVVASIRCTPRNDGADAKVLDRFIVASCKVDKVLDVCSFGAVSSFDNESNLNAGLEADGPDNFIVFVQNTPRSSHLGTVEVVLSRRVLAGMSRGLFGSCFGHGWLLLFCFVEVEEVFLCLCVECPVFGKKVI